MGKKGKSSKEARKGHSARATEKRIAHAVIHPVRLDALSILFERTASPKEIARLLRRPLGTVSFHVKELLEDDAVELVKTEQRRGAIEHYYRATLRPEVGVNEWRVLPNETRRKIASLALQAIITEGLSSLRHDKMEKDEDFFIAWTPMRLGKKGQDEVTALQVEMLERLMDIKAQDEDRPDKDEESTPVRIAAMMWFERGRPAGEIGRDSLGPTRPAE